MLVYVYFMNTSSILQHKNEKKKRGRPPLIDDEGNGMLSLNIRIPVVLKHRVDEWRRGQPDIPGRAESIRRLLERALQCQD
jgi:hypothetical protein